MQITKKVRAIITALTLAVFIMATPVTSFASEGPNLIPSIEIRFSMGVTVTLTDVHEDYLDFGNDSMGVWMPPTGTIAFNFAGEPTCPVLGTLYEGVPFTFQDIASRMESDLDWIDYVTFFLVIDFETWELLISTDAEYLIEKGLTDWIVFNINGFLSFESFAEQLQVRGRPLRELEVLPPPQPLYDVTPLIPSITMRPPVFYGETDLVITFTDVYDLINAVGITGMTSYEFYIAPTGTISFDRDVEFIEFADDVASVKLTAEAGEVINMREHSWLTIYYGTYTFDEFPYNQRRYFTFFTAHDPGGVPLLYDHDWPAWCGVCTGICRISNHAVPNESASPPEYGTDDTGNTSDIGNSGANETSFSVPPGTGETEFGASSNINIFAVIAFAAIAAIAIAVFVVVAILRLTKNS